MRIRSKLLILLLTITLVPLIIAAALGNRAMYRLGKAIGSGARQALIERAEWRLRLFISGQAALLAKERKTIELALRLQAENVEQCLAAAVPPDRKLYFAEDYLRNTDAPQDMTTTDRHVRISENGQHTPIPVSLTHQVFKLPLGVAAPSVADDLRRLDMMTPTYRELYGENIDVFCWQHTGLENGVYGCYPGHGGYPESYDCRERAWYQHAKARAGICWTRPHVDVSFREAILTASVGVRRPDGSFAGVTAIEVAIADVVDRSHLPKRRSSLAFLATMESREEFDPTSLEPARPRAVEPEKCGLFVLALFAGDANDPHWDAPSEVTWLASDDRDRYVELLADMIRSQEGIRYLSYQGRLSLWAYCHVWDENTYLILVAPEEETIAEAVQAEQAILSLTYWQIGLTGGILVLVSFVAAVIAWFGARTVAQPIGRLAEAARRIARGDLRVHVGIDRRDELGQLGRAFDEMVPQLRDRLRMSQALSLAREIQRRLLPATPPKIEGLDVAGKTTYCEETGGDYFDFFDLSEPSLPRLGVAVGDVCGHGITASLLMTRARTLLHELAGHTANVSELMTRVNQHLAADTPVGQFMTLLYMVIEPRGRKILWVNAGHDPTILYDPASDTFEDLGADSRPLGIDDEGPYEESTHEGLRTGQIIVIGTDGIWQTRNADGLTFGRDRLREVIRLHAEDSASQIATAIAAAVEGFRQSAPLEDDVTLVVVKHLG